LILKPNYYRATNAAYEIISRMHALKFPMNVLNIAKQYPKLRAASYSDMARRFNMSFGEFYHFASSGHGYLQRDSKDLAKAYIVYNDYKDETTIRFTQAHELAHYVLGHTEDNDLFNKEANCFARNLLCPIPVVNELGIQTINDYMYVFGISEPMAKVCVNFKEADYYHITHKNYVPVSDLAVSYITGYSVPALYGYTCLAI